MNYTDSTATGAELGLMTSFRTAETPLLHDVPALDPWAKVARRATRVRARMLASIDVLEGFLDDRTVLEDEFIDEFSADAAATTLVLEAELGPPASLDLTESNIAVSAVNDLIQWLGRTVEGVAELIGVSRRQIFTWRARPDLAPRPASVERLYEIHAALMPLAMAVGQDRMPIELRSGVPTLVDLLDGGDVATVAAASRERAKAAFSLGADQPISAERLAAANDAARRQFEAAQAVAPSDAGGDHVRTTPPDE